MGRRSERRSPEAIGNRYVATPMRRRVWGRRVSKEIFYRNGGFSNSGYYRRMVRGSWQYFQE